MNFPGIELLETESKYKSRKKTWPFCVYHLHKRPRDGISRRGRAVTAKKWTMDVQSSFSLIKTTFFAILVAVNVIVAYFESSLILTVDGKCVRGAGQLGPMMRRRRKTLSILRYRKCCASTSKLFSLLSFNTKWTYRYIFFVFVRRDWLYEVPTQHHLRPD